MAIICADTFAGDWDEITPDREDGYIAMDQKEPEPKVVAFPEETQLEMLKGTFTFGKFVSSFQRTLTAAELALSPTSRSAKMSCIICFKQIFGILEVI